MDASSDSVKLIAIAASSLAVLGYIVYLLTENRALKSELEQSQFQVEKDENAKVVSSESNSSLVNELNKDVGTSGSPKS